MVCISETLIVSWMVGYRWMAGQTGGYDGAEAWGGTLLARQWQNSSLCHGGERTQIRFAGRSTSVNFEIDRQPLSSVYGVYTVMIVIAILSVDDTSARRTHRAEGSKNFMKFSGLQSRSTENTASVKELFGGLPDPLLEHKRRTFSWTLPRLP